MTGAGRPRVLIVDDEESVTFALRRYLEREGFAVECADEAERAMAILDRGDVDLLLADLRLSGVSGQEGFALVEHVRDRHPACRSILLTAYGTEEIEQEASRRGAALVLAKPQALADVVTAIRRVLGTDES